MSLKGSRELKARLKAIRVAFKPIGRSWAEETVKVMRPMVPVSAGRTRGKHEPGRLRESFRVRNATQRKAVVGGHYSAYFVDKGPKVHGIAPKNWHGPFVGNRSPRLAWNEGGRTIFARKVNHPGYRGRPFRRRAAVEALRRKPMAQGLIAEWNRAANGP